VPTSKRRDGRKGGREGRGGKGKGREENKGREGKGKGEGREGLVMVPPPPTIDSFRRLCCLHSRAAKASPPFDWYSLRLPTKG